ncbi:hypothetical protein [Halodesulfovibrio sp.]|jgi:hypothetical protein|uniref:hypothetical protein n=1 Tax=Halodesulfovibrio sp. TaxID=1912772 RepID=UPI0025D4F240|nr:hypothetical protein [Halodesulfovibrio sp.]MCT4534768.1 hypothetical protein [Halodesulfovibrio sp.]
MAFRKLKENVKRPSGQDSFFTTLLNDLPPIIPRKEVPKYVGNLISVGYLAHLDSAGQGPESRRIGGCIVYERESFVRWLESRTGDS